MNSKQWRDCGLKVIFRHGKVYLYIPTESDALGAGGVFFTDNNCGEWMKCNDLQKAPWRFLWIDELSSGVQKTIKAATELCYCDRGVGTCDFCSGIRDPMSYLKKGG